MTTLVMLPGCGDQEWQGQHPSTADQYDFFDVFSVLATIDLEEPDGVVNVRPYFTVSDSTIWVADESEQQFRRYTMDGRLVGFFGRAGQGPGEFESPVRAVPVDDDLIIALDRTRPASVWAIGPDNHEEASFVAQVELRDPLRLNDGRLVGTNGILLASYLDASSPRRVGMGAYLAPLARQDLDSSIVRLEPEALGIRTRIAPDLASAYAVAGWTAVDVRDNLLAVAAALQDTVQFRDMDTGDAWKIQLPTHHFRLASPVPAEAQTNPEARLAWMESFSAISDVFLVSEELVLVQYQDFVDQVPVYHLLGVTTAGAPLFEVRDVPRIVALKPGDNSLLGQQGPNALPNELAWYSLEVP